MDSLINRNPDGAKKQPKVKQRKPKNSPEVIKERNKEYMKKYMKNKYATNQEFREKAKAYTRARYEAKKDTLKAKKDPEEVKRRNAEYYRNKCATDPTYLEKIRAYNKKNYHKYKAQKNTVQSS